MSATFSDEEISRMAIRLMRKQAKREAKRRALADDLTRQVMCAVVCQVERWHADRWQNGEITFAGYCVASEDVRKIIEHALCDA